jgi:Na+-translocating ferredoxin:NAD+ oxidoreductase subunit B
MSPILVTSFTIAGAGLLCGTALALAARFLGVDEDPRIETVTQLLPGANCGGCGYAGCADYAKAIVLDGAPINLCAPGGAETLALLASEMGIEAEATVKKVALVLCGGDAEKAVRKHAYNGIADCAAAHAVGGGDKVCAYGCLGYGSCTRVCPTGAIEITEHGLAVVHSELCIGCGACVNACPRNLIRLVPVNRSIHVLCSSRDKGPVVKKACSVGCIGCAVCTKLADNAAITMDGALAVVDYDKELTNAAVVAKCPGKCIVQRKLSADGES